GRSARVRGSEVGLRAARGGGRSNRPTSIPPEGRASAPGPRRRESGRAGIGAALGPAALEGCTGCRQRDPPKAAHDGNRRRESGGAEARSPVSTKRFSPAGDDRIAGGARR